MTATRSRIIGRGRRAARRTLRRQLWDHQGGRCFYCGVPTELNASCSSDRLATLDHRIPRSAGGGRGANLVIACLRCNQLKGDLPEATFRARLYAWLRTTWGRAEMQQAWDELRGARERLRAIG